MTSGGKRKPRYGFEDIVMPRRLPRPGRSCQPDIAIRTDGRTSVSARCGRPYPGAQCIRYAKYIKRPCKTLDASSNIGHTMIHGGSWWTIPAKAARICRATERAWLPPGRFAYGQEALTPAGRRGDGQGG